MIDVITNVLTFARSITIVNTFGDRLRHARTLRQLTQAELARACGLSQGAIGNYEADSRRNAKEIFRIAEVLQVEAAWLAMGTGPMEPDSRLSVADAAVVSVNKPAWPFTVITPERILSLTIQQRSLLEQAMLSMITVMEESAADSERTVLPDGKK